MMKNFYNRWFPRVCLFAGAGLFLLALTLMCILGASFNNGFTMLLGLGGVIAGWLYNRGRRFQAVVNALMVTVVLFFMLTAGLMTGAGMRDTATFREKHAIVLGCGIKGERVTPTLRARLDRALDYARRNPNAVLIVSGGQGKGERITEALAMERYLVAHGVAAEKIICEKQSTSTVENLKFSREILSVSGVSVDDEVVLITSRYHLYRALKIAQSQGIRANSCGAGISWHLLPGAFLRESVSIGKFWWMSR